MNEAVQGSEGGGATARYAALAPGVPLIESPFFERFAHEAFPEKEVRKIARKLNTDGLAVFNFPEPDFDRIAEEIKSSLNGRFEWPAWRSHAWNTGLGMRIQDAWSYNANVKKIACNAAVMHMLSRLYGRRVWPFQTLNFPVGTQQHVHTDTVHFSTIPERFMCGVWVALEDIKPDSGPLLYYPGSHKWPLLYNDMLGVRVSGRKDMPTQAVYEEYWSELVKTLGIQPTSFTPRKGQALIWSANLLHGGARQTNVDATRWSQVTHYFADDCVYMTPMMSDLVTGNIHFREMIDISTGKIVKNRYCGADLPELIKGVTYHRDTRFPVESPQGARGTLREKTRRVVARAGLLGVATTTKRLYRRARRAAYEMGLLKSGGSWQ